MKKKYAPLIVVLYFVAIGLVVSLILSIINYFLEGGSLFKMLEAPTFIAFFVIFLGIIYCEIAYRIKNSIFGSILFSLIGPQLFLLLNIGLLWFTDGIIRDIPLDWYLTLSLLLGGILGALYYGIISKQNT